MRYLVLGSLMMLGSIGTAVAQDAPPPSEWHSGRRHGGRGPLFISPMGEPFRGEPGGVRPEDAWFDGADANHDGVLTEDEMVADAARFFALLDQRKDGEIDPDDIERYETLIAPEIRVSGFGGGGGWRGGRGGGGHRRGHGDGPGVHGTRGDEPEGGSDERAMPEVPIKQGAARFGYLDYPEPVTVADRNLNRGVDSAEFAKAASTRFALLDANKDGRIEKSELPKLRGFGGRPPRGDKGERQDIPQ